MKIRSIAAALLFTLAAQVQAAPLISLTDPEGDDAGDGSLIYPREPIAELGDLDLRALRVFDDGDALRFEVTFRNPVRDPAQVKSGLLGSEDLSLFARRGFYAFNLDIYLDLDRASDSGHTVALPGRRARIAPAHAWERAIVLTPRPELMRRQLRDALADGAPAGLDLDAVIDTALFFVRDARVRGRVVSFTVPARFVDAKAFANASLIAMVTGAKLSIESEIAAALGRSASAGSPIERLPLGVAVPEAGRPALAMGYRGAAAPATAIVDLLTPDARQQAAQLTSGVLSGLNAQNGYGTTATTMGAGPVAASNVKADAWLQRALMGQPGPAAAAVLPGAAPVAAASPAVAPAPAAPASAAAAAAARPAASAPAAPPRLRDAAYLEEQENRLRTLRRLRDANLISEEEFQRKRKEIIDAL